MSDDTALARSSSAMPLFWAIRSRMLRADWNRTIEIRRASSSRMSLRDCARSAARVRTVVDVA
jgi:hypothetical protein